MLYRIYFSISYTFVGMKRTFSLALRAGVLSRYEQEASEAQRRFVESSTYPGPLRVATPGDTQFYMGSVATILPHGEKHYWRAVVDDPEVRHVIPLRVRFKCSVWVTTGWETRMQVVSVVISPSETVGELIRRVTVENQSPYLCRKPFSICIDGKELDASKTLLHYEVDEYTHLDAIESDEHECGDRYKNWNVDEISPDELNQSPYKEMNLTPNANLAPRYEARPLGFFGKNDYSGMKQR